MDNNSQISDDKYDEIYNRFEKLFEELRDDNLEVLEKKHGKETLFEKIFGQDYENYYMSFFQFLAARRHAVINEIFGDVGAKLPVISKVKLNSIIAACSNINDLKAKQEEIKIISQELTVNEKAPERLFEESKSIENVYDKLQNLMLNHFAYQYLTDTLKFYKLDDTKLRALLAEVETFSEELETELKHIIEKEENTNKDALVKKSVELLKKLGRTQFYIKQVEEEKNLSKIGELLVRLEISIKAAQDLKNLNPDPNNLEEKAIESIKKLLTKDMVF